MSISTRIFDPSARISMSGRFDFKVHRDFKEAYIHLLDDAAIREIEVDMGDVEYMDSSALGMLLLLHERATALKKSVSLINTTGAVSKLLEVANFNKIFNFKH